MTSEEQRFAMGLGAIVVVIALTVTVFNYIDTGDDSPEPTQSAKRVAPAVSELQPSAPQSGDSVAVVTVEDSQPAVDSTESAVAGERDSASVVVEGVEGEIEQLAAPEEDSTATVPHVIDPVPLEYFAPDSNTLNLPAVLEKYIERVDRGTRFMARLEQIVADQTAGESSITDALELTFTVQAQSKRLSYNATHTTQWTEAAFTSSNAPNTPDVLVDVRRGDSLDEPGDRLAFFFASLQERDGVLSFALDVGDVGEDSVVIVYALDDALSPLGAAGMPAQNR